MDQMRIFRMAVSAIVELSAEGLRPRSMECVMMATECKCVMMATAATMVG